MEKQRQSNIELLRLLCMLVLPFLHFCVFCLPQSENYALQGSVWAQLPKVLCSFMTLQVNIFVLISGWFGIHTTFKKIVTFYLMCAFYGVLTLGLSLLLPTTSFSFKNLAISFLPFSFFPGWWFVKAYLFLMLLAPLFNKAIEAMSKKEFLWALCALTIINVYCGFFARQAINPDGCNFMQVMFMYFVGRYLALHVTFDEKKLRKWTAITIPLSVGLYAMVWILNDEVLHLVNSLTFFNNNNPWSLFNSIIIFLFFTTIPFQSKAINWLARGVFAVYLIHTSIWVAPYWNKEFTMLYDSYSPGVAWGVVTALFIAYFFIVLGFDHLRSWITDPIANGINKLFEKYVKRINLHI